MEERLFRIKHHMRSKANTPKRRGEVAVHVDRIVPATCHILAQSLAFTARPRYVAQVGTFLRLLLRDLLGEN